MMGIWLDHDDRHRRTCRMDRRKGDEVRYRAHHEHRARASSAPSSAISCSACLGMSFGGFLGQLIVAVIGACVLIYAIGPSRVARPPDGHHPRQHGKAAASGKGPQAGYAGAAQAGLDPGEGARIANLCRNPEDRPRQQAGHGLRGGGLPQHRRMLVEEARHLHDHGRHLHQGLRLLQCEDRHAGCA